MNNSDNIVHLISFLGNRISELEKRIEEHDRFNVDERLDRLENITFLRNIHSISDLINLRFGEFINTFRKISGGINFEDRHFESRLNRLKKIYQHIDTKGAKSNKILIDNGYRNIYIDITQTVANDKISGISRVSKELASAALILGAVPVFQWGLKYITYNPASGSYRKIKLSPPDILLLPDASWLSPDLADVIKESREKGAKIAFLLHDIIPIRHPHFCDPFHNQLFTKWLTEIVFNADCIISVTEAVAHDTEKYMDEIEFPVERRPVLRWSHSGVDLPPTIDEESPHRFLFNTLSRPVYLSVGAIEPKKNYSLILNAVEKAWEEGADFNYIIVGSYGWGQTRLKNRILDHYEFGNRLQWFQSISDTELVYLYKNCHYLIQGSIAEGFGLPVVEAASYGLSSICSDIPVLREITQGKAKYFDTKDSGHLAKILKETVKKDKVFCTFRPETWNASARRTINLLCEL